MKIALYQKPPNYTKIVKAIPGVAEGKHIVFTYGDTIYVPGGGEISTDLMRHEETHWRQQNALGIDEWWDRYLAEPEFRFTMELAAYRNQYKVICTYEKRRAAFYLNAITRDLSGAMYGNICSRSRAKKLIMQAGK